MGKKKANIDILMKKIKLPPLLVLALVLIFVLGISWFIFNVGRKAPVSDKGDKNIDSQLKQLFASSSYQELKKQHPDLIKSPNIDKSEIKMEAVSPSGQDSQTYVHNPANYTYEFKPEIQKISQINIQRGDIVTFVNRSNEEIEILGDGWNTVMPLSPEESFSQEFDLKGEYRYLIYGTKVNMGNFSGLIIVE